MAKLAGGMVGSLALRVNTYESRGYKKDVVGEAKGRVRLSCPAFLCPEDASTVPLYHWGEQQPGGGERAMAEDRESSTEP